MSTEQLARYEALWEKLHKLGGVPAGARKVELLLEGLAGLVEDSGQDEAAGKDQRVSTKPPAQIHVHQCPDCNDATITTGRGRTPLTPAELERLSCDAEINEPGKPNRVTIKPSVKRQILSRDQHRCQAPGCRNTRFLEVHHIIPRRLGGTNDAENLTTLCALCHGHLHENHGRNFGPTCSEPDCPPGGDPKSTSLARTIHE